MDELREESYKLSLDQCHKLDEIRSRLKTPKERLGELHSNSEDDNAESTMPKDTELPSLEYAGIKNHPTSQLSPEELKSMEAHFSNLTVTTKDLLDVAKEQAILKSLHFPSRGLRNEDISPPRGNTYQWILESQTEMDDEEHSSLLAWLRYGDGMFWVSGKAGSGKSTLMKFIAEHDRTRQALQTWAGQMELVIAAHYFWSPGTPMQKSQRGLLQTLLYGIFRACPALISIVCPSRFVQNNSRSRSTTKDWSMHELLSTLKAVARCFELPFRYCIFIDGIDEFDGDHFELCLHLKELSSSPSFKICLSSRPWNVFEDELGQEPCRKIYVHELTRTDIFAYAQGRLKEHSRWNTKNFQEHQMEAIVDGITDRAQGVFLWVFLVTQSLRQGLTDGDTWLDLCKRLDTLPTDLKRFFKHMLDGIDPIYKKKTAHMLSLATNAHQPHSYLIYCMLEFEYEEGDDVTFGPSQITRDTDLDTLLDQCQRRVNARCGGLLEVKHRRVEFLHRTVRDFLLTREMSDYIAERSGPKFFVNLSTLRAYTRMIKSGIPSVEWMLLDEDRLLMIALHYVNDALDESVKMQPVCLNSSKIFMRPSQ